MIRPIVATLLFVSCAACVGPMAQAAERPNIVFILADDLGYGDLSCFGQTHYKTPHLDKMAAQGMRLTNHYSGSTVCAPSRACLLSGMHTGHVYNRINGTQQFRENPHDITVATRLQGAGYHTAMIGKSGLSCNSDDGSLPARKGFDYFFGYVSHRAAHRYYPQMLWLNGEKRHYAGNHGKQGDTYSGDLFLNSTLEYLQQRALLQQPFFLHLSLQQPHADLAVPERYRQRFAGQFDERPSASYGNYRREERPKSTYAGMVTYLDDTVGAVLDKLRELGMAENTLVVFSSDNGAMSEGGWSRELFNSSGPLRGGKRDLYEGGIRVPTIACWPGKVPAGVESSHVSAFWDFAPTACELAGVDIEKSDNEADEMNRLDGISYAPTLLGGANQRKHEYLYWEFYEQGGKQAVRWGDWKGVRLNVRKNRKASIELYNLATDLGETQNVADEHPRVVEKIDALMAEAHEPSPIASFGSVSTGRGRTGKRR